MAKVVVTKRWCPVCQYEHKVETSPNGKQKVTKGDKEFNLLRNPSNVRFEGKPEFIGMFCPSCGVFLDIDTCTVTKEKEKK